ncbi:uncharacterized protein LOC142985556 [Anticarsia gemmatalis]|uniref:uncharacterized protein LOC142985556 n=1 Tax=Anticarsia gemmatalis TaxID=129554 RepID=UPI003F75AB5C
MNGKFFSNTLIPKSVLFQCNLCQVNFISCYSATQHAVRCDSKTEFTKCDICKRKIRNKDYSVHQNQHQLNEKLKIYTIHRNMYELVWLKCPKCCVCFDERLFWSHTANCSGDKLNYIRCTDCSIDITKDRFTAHKTKHKLKKYTKKDFIVVEFAKKDLNVPTKKDKKELPAPAKVKPLPSPAKIKITDRETVERDENGKIVLYYCKFCDSYKHVPTLRYHADGYCKTFNIQYCDVCGLGFGCHNYKLHRNNHIKSILHLEDFKIISLSTGEEMQPPVPKFHCCKTCKVHFLTVDKLKLHQCRLVQFEFCKTCFKKFSLNAYPAHLNFHTDIPEILKVYNDVDDMWNVAYICAICDLVTMTYDSAVTHSQGHINDLERPRSKICKICNFDLIEDCYETHKEIHLVNSSVNRKKFRILKYDYKHLYSSHWMTMFAPLPKRHKYQILSKSMHGTTRRLKLTCEIDNITDEMKYICKKCKTTHPFNEKCKFSSKYVCTHCDSSFNDLLDFVNHEKSHTKNEKLYKIITFNDPKDKDFNLKLKEFDKTKFSKPKPKTVQTKILTKKFKSMGKVKPRAQKNESVITNVETLKKIKLYKCDKCGSCMTLKRNICNHNCSLKTKKRCEYCNELFSTSHLNNHLELHKQYPNVKTAVIYFNKNAPSATIYKCDCGLHYITKESIDRHIQICNQNLDISKEICSKCNHLFPTDVLVNHLCKHHSKPVKIVVKNVKKSSKFQCEVCSVVYDNMNDFDEHTFVCSEVNKHCNVCEKCDRLFDHKCNHSCDDQFSIVKPTTAFTTVFHCHICDLNYFCRKGLKYHLNIPHTENKFVQPCKVCGLKFCEPNMTKHKSFMHKSESRYIIKVVEVSTGKKYFVKGENNLEIESEDEADEAYEAESDTSEKVDDNKRKLPTHSKNTRLVTKKLKIDPNFTLIQEFNFLHCSKCDVCFLNKGQWDYHIAVNHVMKRNNQLVLCRECGLNFYQTIIPKHQYIHRECKKFKIKLFDPETGKTTIKKGVNKSYGSVKSSKRKLAAENLKSKRLKTDDQTDQIIDQTVDQVALEQPSTSKIDFESVTMADDEHLSENENVDTDPLNSTENYDSDETIDVEKVDSVPETCKNSDPKSPNDDFISDRLKTLLNAKESSYSNKLYKCTLCGLHFLVENTMDWHIRRDHTKKFTSQECKICHLLFSPMTLLRHVYIHHTKMNITDSNSYEIIQYEDDFILNVQGKHNKKAKKDLKINYFKCSQCNVCFLDDVSCLKHLSNHILLDPKLYIECKLCNFQFLIDSLKKHLSLHHNSEFRMQNVVISEYKCGENGFEIKVIKGVDKLQSHLVSTTTDSQENE